MSGKQASTKEPRRQPAAVLPAVRDIIGSAVDAANLHLWDLSLAREAGRDVLRVQVDRIGGVNASAISDLTRAISNALDEADVVGGNSTWVLEVGTPGAERVLRSIDDCAICVGREAQFTVDGASVKGNITGVDGGSVTVDDRTIAWEDITHAQLLIRGVKENGR